MRGLVRQWSSELSGAERMSCTLKGMRGYYSQNKMVRAVLEISGRDGENRDDRRHIFRKMSRISSLTGFKGSERNTLSELIPRFPNLHLGWSKVSRNHCQK